MAFDPQQSDESSSVSSTDSYLMELTNLADRYGWEQEQWNETSRVIGFSRYNRRRHYLERVNIYYTTGTVGTCIDHPKHSKTQLFRRNQSLSDIGRIFEDPRTHTGHGYYFKKKHPTSADEPIIPGTGFCFSLNNNDYDASINKNLDRKQTDMITLSRNGYLVLEHDGSCWYQSIPRDLHNKLNGRSRQRGLAPVHYITIDSSDAYDDDDDDNDSDCYFVEFCDGTQQWFGPQSLSNTIRRYNRSKKIKILQFAPNDGWLIQYEDGTIISDNIPQGLYNQIYSRRKDLPHVENVAIGPNHEWFVIFNDGSYRTGNISDDLSEKLDKLEMNDHDVSSIEFGANQSWVVRFHY